ncbi:MAG: hypothetical protein ACO3EZ_12345 [Prochlorotrichaceae cyanobacterium]
MLEIVLNWKPNPELLGQLLTLAQQRQKSLEMLLSEAVSQYLRDAENQNQDSGYSFLRVEDDPIVGLYEGSPDLSVRDEDILLSEIQTNSGWTCKE